MITYHQIWMEFCIECGWFRFVEKPKGQSMLRLQIYGVKATDEELEIINRILSKAEEGSEGNWRDLK